MLVAPWHLQRQQDCMHHGGWQGWSYVINGQLQPHSCWWSCHGVFNYLLADQDEAFLVKLASPPGGVHLCSNCKVILLHSTIFGPTQFVHNVNQQAACRPIPQLICYSRHFILNVVLFVISEIKSLVHIYSIANIFVRWSKKLKYPEARRNRLINKEIMQFNLVFTCQHRLVINIMHKRFFSAW